jgi:hypothetical protein
MSAEGQRFGRSAAVRVTTSPDKWVPIPTGGERLTHAEQALKSLGHSTGLVSAACRARLGEAAEIERVAREVVDRFGLYHQPDDCAICRLRALVQPS